MDFLAFSPRFVISLSISPPREGIDVLGALEWIARRFIAVSSAVQLNTGKEVQSRTNQSSTLQKPPDCITIRLITAWEYFLTSAAQTDATCWDAFCLETRTNCVEGTKCQIYLHCSSEHYYAYLVDQVEIGLREQWCQKCCCFALTSPLTWQF